MAFAIVVITALGAITLRFFMPSWVVFVVIFLAAAGYYQFSYKPAQSNAEQTQGN